MSLVAAQSSRAKSRCSWWPSLPPVFAQLFRSAPRILSRCSARQEVGLAAFRSDNAGSLRDLVLSSSTCETASSSWSFRRRKLGLAAWARSWWLARSPSLRPAAPWAFNGLLVPSRRSLCFSALISSARSDCVELLKAASLLGHYSSYSFTLALVALQLSYFRKLVSTLACHCCWLMKQNHLSYSKSQSVPFSLRAVFVFHLLPVCLIPQLLLSKSNNRVMQTSFGHFQERSSAKPRNFFYRWTGSQHLESLHIVEYTRQYN